jgi:hypothetical protein
MRSKRGKGASTDWAARAASPAVESCAPIAAKPIALIDAALVRIAGRRSVAVSEVTDILLDLRTQILLDANVAELVQGAR